MSYPITCKGGFPVPLVVGKMEITGLHCTINDTTATAQIAVFDDQSISGDAIWGNLIPLADIYTTDTMLCDIKTIANSTGEIYYEFAEPIKTRKGISISADNIKAGSICLYRR